MKVIRRTHARISIILLIPLILISWILLSSNSSFTTVEAAGPEAISLGVTVISEGDDFATRVLGFPWDMNGDPYPDYPTTFTNFDRGTFSASGDVWSIQGGVDPYVWFLNPSIKDTQKELG